MWLIQQQCDADQSPCQILPSKPGPFWVYIALHFIQEHLADILSKCQVWQGPWGRGSSLPIDGLSDFSTQRIIQDLCSGYRGWINLDQDLWFCHTAWCSWMIRINRQISPGTITWMSAICIIYARLDNFGWFGKLNRLQIRYISWPRALQFWLSAKGAKCHWHATGFADLFSCDRDP